MKRKFAVAMSAVLAATSTMPAMAESETATEFAPTTYVGEFSVTADGESMLFSLKAEQFAEDGVSLSASVTLPASVTGEAEDTTYGLNDVLRIVSGDLYINLAEVCSVYESLSGSSISSILDMVGIDQDWVEIPAVDVEAAQTEAASEFSVDSLTNDLTALMDNFDVQTAEDGSTTVNFDGPAVVAAVQSVENLWDMLTAQRLSAAGTVDASQITGVFSDYILAAAEGINEMDSEVSIDDAQAQILEIVNAVVQETLSSIEITPLQTEDGQKLSEQIQQMLDEGATVNGTMTVNADATMAMNAAAVKDGETVAIDASFDGTNYNAVVTENGTEVANVNLVLTEQENGFGVNIAANSDGESISANIAITMLDNGISVAVTADDSGADAFVASITSEDGVTITDVEAPQATLLRDVVKNVVKLFYVLSESGTAEEVSTVAAE